MLTRIEEFISFICMGVMVVIIGMQVFNRYLLGSSLVWSEELGRFLFIWSVWVGCSLAMRSDRHLRVTALSEFSGRRMRFALDVFAQVATLIFCGFVVVWGISMIFFLMRTGQEAPALEVPIYWVYMALPLGMALMSIRCLQNLYALFTGQKIETSDISSI
ncbi:TRAP transporter small permease [Ruegeria sp. 2205SS24-7]|uniref:TRAP transporter small permease n=1 Tax=Ruegeria discodermiae TaxID=3064389 RepID=UPI0027410DC4|nr:TRAP transporter small permease [Ruegeria sp. 2205SS24-7]MDP5220580.1 TRAP transporter small permease [Ruegeria sp. 2205SS24-7]